MLLSIASGQGCGNGQCGGPIVGGGGVVPPAGASLLFVSAAQCLRIFSSTAMPLPIPYALYI